jgi:hypothetical protein
MRSASVAVVSVAFVLVVVGSAWGSSSDALRVIGVRLGTSRTFTRTQLQPGDTLRCADRGRDLSVTVPVGRWEGQGTAWADPSEREGPALFHLNLSVTPRGYAVECGPGGLYWGHPVTR